VSAHPFRQRGEGFGPEDIRAMAAALQEAVRRLGLSSGDKDTELIARHIIRLALDGERNPELLCEGALVAANHEMRASKQTH
jgi:hypothetical protein